MKQQVTNLLEATTGTAADMTHNLCLLGGGDMGTGIRNLWIDGYGTGAIATATVLGGGCLIYWMATHKRRNLKKIETVGTAFNTGFEVGRRQEREFREYMAERGEDIENV